MRRPGRMPIGSNDVPMTPPTWPRALAAATRGGWLLVLCSFAIDLGGAHLRWASISHARMRGWLAGLGLALAVAGVLALLLGAVRVLAARSAAAPTGNARARLSGWLWGDGAAEQRLRVAGLLGGSLALIGYAALSFAIARRVVVDIAQPRNAAAVLVAAQLGLGLVALLA